MSGEITTNRWGGNPEGGSPERTWFRTANRSKAILNEERVRSKQSCALATFDAPHSALVIIRLFDGDALGQIPRLIHVRAFEISHVVGQKLKGDREKDRRQGRKGLRDDDHVVYLFSDGTI